MVLLETLALSILNHDTAVASAAARMVSAADGRPIIEMGSRRTHEQAAIAAARAAYIAGFAGSSNLAAQRRYGVPALGTSAHAFTMLHSGLDGAGGEPLGRRTDEWERAAFRAQVDTLGTNTTLLVDTYDVTAGVANAVEVAGAGLGGVRIDSGDLPVLAHQVRCQLDDLGARHTRIVVSGDLDEFAIAALRAEPIDSYGVGTSVVTGSGAPTANMVYKLVEVDGMPVEKRSSNKESHGGYKHAMRLARPTGTVLEEVVYPAGAATTVEAGRTLTVPLVRGGEPVIVEDLSAARARVVAGLKSLPWDGLKLSRGEPVIPTRMIPAVHPVEEGATPAAAVTDLLATAVDALEAANGPAKWRWPRPSRRRSTPASTWRCRQARAPANRSPTLCRRSRTRSKPVVLSLFPLPPSRFSVNSSSETYRGWPTPWTAPPPRTPLCDPQGPRKLSVPEQDP